MNMTNEQIQKHIIQQMKDKALDIKEGRAPRSNWRTSIHFVPSIGQYSYDDKRVPEDVVIPLIKDGTLFFSGIAMHQSERCPQYKLSKSCR